MKTNIHRKKERERERQTRHYTWWLVSFAMLNGADGCSSGGAGSGVGDVGGSSGCRCVVVKQINCATN